MARAPRIPTTEQIGSGKRPPLTERQRRAIQGQRRALQAASILTEARYRALLAEHSRETDPALYGRPCTSSTHLSRRQAREVISALELMGARVGRPYGGSRRRAEAAEAEGVAALATPAQRALIERLSREITWRVSYDAWLAGRTSPTRGTAVISYRDAEAVIEGLHRLRDREAAS